MVNIHKVYHISIYSSSPHYCTKAAAQSGYAQIILMGWMLSWGMYSSRNDDAVIRNILQYRSQLDVANERFGVSLISCIEDVYQFLKFFII